MLKAVGCIFLKLEIAISANIYVSFANTQYPTFPCPKIIETSEAMRELDNASSSLLLSLGVRKEIKQKNLKCTTMFSNFATENYHLAYFTLSKPIIIMTQIN